MSQSSEVETPEIAEGLDAEVVVEMLQGVAPVHYTPLFLATSLRHSDIAGIPPRPAAG